MFNGSTKRPAMLVEVKVSLEHFGKSEFQMIEPAPAETEPRMPQQIRQRALRHMRGVMPLDAGCFCGNAKTSAFTGPVIAAFPGFFREAIPAGKKLV
jgi:hypothetical protein